MDRDFDVGSKVINITVDINNIPESVPDSKRHRNSKDTFIGNVFTAFRNHQNPRRFQTPAKKFQSHVSTSLNRSKNYKIGHTYSNYKSKERDNNQTPAEEGVSKSWQRVAENFWSNLERGTSEDGVAAGEEPIGAKLVAPIVLKLQQKPNKLVSFHQHTNFHHCHTSDRMANFY